jgi:hypothetical protein
MVYGAACRPLISEIEKKNNIMGLPPQAQI